MLGQHQDEDEMEEKKPESAQPSMTLQELEARMEALWPGLFEGETYGPGGDTRELVRRLHYVMFLSPHVKAIEKATNTEYLSLGKNYQETMHRVRRDRRNQPAIWEALCRGERFFEGHQIGGKTPNSVYVYRWSRECVIDRHGMIEEAIRSKVTHHLTCPKCGSQRTSEKPDTILTIPLTGIGVTRNRCTACGYKASVYKFRDQPLGWKPKKKG